jgi:tetratricopeptide (TPR) repeat protein
MADLLTGQLAKARQTVQNVLQKKHTGELHNLPGQIEEKDRKFVEAVNEFEIAAHMDPTEDNRFDWGDELILHRTNEPAIDLFRAASQRYPTSPLIMIGLGMALYARGLYEDAIKALQTAADLDPSESRCYLFLSTAYDSSPRQVDQIIQRFQRYAQLEPNSALAQYYYAILLRDEFMEGKAGGWFRSGYSGSRIAAQKVDITEGLDS